MNLQPFTVAVVGATGVVGRTMIQILNEREFPVGELRLLASGRSAGRTVSIDGRTLEIGEAVPDAFEGVDIALFSAGADISRDLAPAAVARGATVIDNSSAWRMDPTVPLVVSQVNPDDLEGHPGIVANPNCSTMQLAPVLMALRDASASSGSSSTPTSPSPGPAPRPSPSSRARSARTSPARHRPPASIRIRSPSTPCPRSTSSCPNGYTKEEWKVVSENRKILHLPDLRISCTAVRIPVFVSHSEAVHVETREPITPDGRASCSPRSPASSSTTTRPSTLPAGDRSGRPRRDLRRPRPPRRRRSRTTAGSPSGSCRTTCARARRPTPSSWPRSCASAAGSARPPPAAPRPYVGPGAPEATA